MHIWLVNEGESLPCDETKDRLGRLGLLAEELAKEGHRITWFHSSFNHFRKIQRCNKDKKIEIANQYSLYLIRANSYKKNVSFLRVIHHIKTAKEFAKIAKSSETNPPDIILCAMPTIELAEASVQYGLKNNIPTVIDIRDLWPDIFEEVMPQKIKWIIQPYISQSKKRLIRLLQKATAITALTDSFLKWGLNYAQRDLAENDGVFPMAYRKPESTDLLDYKKWNSFNLDRNDFIICFFGTLSKQFNFENMIDAAKQLDNHKNIKFVICGSGETLSTLKYQCKDLSNVIFPGWVNQMEINSLLQISSVGLAPYRYSKNFTMNIPNKFGEYLSVGLPILIEIDGEMYDLIKNFECGFKYNNGKELSEYILTLSSNPLLKEKLARNALNLYNKKFNVSNVYSNMIKQLEKISYTKVL